MKAAITLLVFLFFTLIHIESFGNNQAQNYYAKGMKLVKAEMWQGAEKRFSQAIESNPNFDDAYNARGIVRIHLNDKKGL